MPSAVVQRPRNRQAFTRPPSSCTIGVEERPSLDWDILRLIFPLILNPNSRTTVSHYMRTCRTLYEQGVFFLLDGGVAVGFSPEQVISFSNFISQKALGSHRASRRAQFLHSLRLSPDFLSEKYKKQDANEAKRSLSRAIRCCTNLREITFEKTWIVVDHAELLDVITSLETVDSIDFQEAGSDTYLLIQAAASRSPAAASARTDCHIPKRNLDGVLYHKPPCDLSRIWKSLTHLQLNSLRPDSDPIGSIAKPNCTPPRNGWAHMDLATLAYAAQYLPWAFPNLRTFLWTWGPSLVSERRAADAAVLIRSTTRRDSKIADGLRAFPWTSLDVLRCEVPVAYTRPCRWLVPK